jgi:hypothetical protein
MALTKVTSNVLNDDAVTTSKIVNANVTSSKLAAASVTSTKVGTEFTTATALTPAATIDVDYTAAQVFTLTPNANTTLNITNPVIGVTKAIVVTGAGGSYTVGFTVGGSAGTFNKISGDYSDTAAAKNFIQITCVGATEFWYTISQIA